MRFVSLLLLSLFASLSIIAQPKEIFVKKAGKGLCIEHKVRSGESFYSVGHLYNVAPKTVASYNKLNYDKGLKLSQIILIPLDEDNFSQKATSGVPVYARVKEKESLLKISKAWGNVSVKRMKLWNELRGEDVGKLKKVIIGLLQTKEIKNRHFDKEIVETTEEPAPTENQNAPLQEKQMMPINAAGVNSENRAKQQPPVVKNNSDKPVISDLEPAVADTVTKEPVVPTFPVFKKTVQQRVLADSANRGEGFFKSAFEDQQQTLPVSKESSVTAGIFKTASGWNDEKYYLLINDLTPGTIVKIINPSNGKTIYAKVLGQMSGIRQNEGYDIRISNAAAQVLAIADTEKFIVQIVY
jgi:LysM repeat protein